MEVPRRGPGLRLGPGGHRPGLRRERLTHAAPSGSPRPYGRGLPRSALEVRHEVSCVEWATAPGTVHVRASKHPSGPRPVFAPAGQRLPWRDASHPPGWTSPTQLDFGPVACSTLAATQPQTCNGPRRDWHPDARA
ncbi:DUF397 domain-containing protein [Streptomyces sp. NPDC050523]|uniref:DUF397 domain-containing protein n=1 Tax=Streptomyces sp. NPDC050523 TaxID=3365622 RepID=UPI00379FFF42